MPISPEPASRIPRLEKSSAVQIPASRAKRACSLVMAGSLRKFRVPAATLRFKTPGSSSSPAIPTSTGITWAPAQAAIRQTQDCPVPIFPATMEVTSCPVWVTPSATIPLSAHMTAMAFFSRDTSARPWAAAIRTISSSSTPRPFKGFAILSHRFRAASAASRLAGFT